VTVAQPGGRRHLGLVAVSVMRISLSGVRLLVDPPTSQPVPWFQPPTHAAPDCGQPRRIGPAE
jgi:hypothetical protein